MQIKGLSKGQQVFISPDLSPKIMKELDETPSSKLENARQIAPHYS